MHNKHLLSVFQNKKFQEKVHSILIKTERKENKKISSKELSFRLNIGQQYISDIEERRRKPAKELLNDIYKALDVIFDDDLSIVKKTEGKFEEFLEYYFLNDDNQKDVIKSIVNDNSLRYSYAFGIVLICDYINNYFIFKTKEIDFNEKKLSNNILYLLNDMDPVYHSVFYLFKGRYYYQKNDVDKAKENYLIALEHASTYSNELMDGLKGCIYHNYGFLLARENKLYEAEDQLKKALSYLKSQNYIRRIIHAENTLSLVYMNLHQYQMASAQQKKTLRLIKQANQPRYYAMIYSNIATLSFVQGNYEACINDSIKALEYDDEYNPLYYFLSWSYYKLGDIENCRKYYNILNQIDLSDDEFTRRFTEMIALYLEKASTADIFKHLREFYKYTRKNEIINYQIDVLKLLIDFCKENEKHKYLSEYQQILLELYEKM